jgi:hypothetical protein
VIGATPVPYVVKSALTLGVQDVRRSNEVVLERKCQVCGLSCDGEAFGIVYLDDPGWGERILNGMMHEPCLRIALDHCPTLARWSNMTLFRFEASELPTSPAGIPILPVAMQTDPLDPSDYRS